MTSRLLPLAVLFVLVGCRGAPLGEVEGIVTCKDKPLGNVLVTFVSDPGVKNAGAPSSGVTDAEGRYRLLTPDRRVGAVLGAHRVVVYEQQSQGEVIVGDKDSDGGPPLRTTPRFPAEYSDPLRSPLKAEVKPGKQTVDLLLLGRVP